MKYQFWCLSFLFFNIYINGATAQETSNYTYNAAVVEYQPERNFSDALTINSNEYISLLDGLRANQTELLDIIVFPESTLMSAVSEETAAEVPLDNSVLCNSTNPVAEFLKNLSCAAIKHNTIIVVNIVEKENCTAGNSSVSCPTTGVVLYNTNVAINGSGIIIARYRKWNLFGEYSKTKPAELDLPTIQIKNATLGMFTCFDILFGEPALNLTRNMGVRNIIFPTMWFSELPYLTALQVQQMWAQENDAVLLAAGANDPSRGSGGSGIFLGVNGPLEHEMLGEGGTRVLFQTVPIPEIENNTARDNITFVQETSETADTKAKTMDGFTLTVDTSIKDHNSVILNTSNADIEEEVCHGEVGNIICCQFNISITLDQNASSPNTSQYTYQLAAFNGVRSFSGVKNGGIETCAVLACLNSSVSSCGQRFSNYSEVSWPVTFQRINVSGNFTTNERTIQFPNSLLSSIRPVHPNLTTWLTNDSNGTVIRAHTLNSPQNRLLTFGIYGRDFSRDSDPVVNDTTTTTTTTTDYTTTDVIDTTTGVDSAGNVIRINSSIVLLIVSAWIAFK